MQKFFITLRLSGWRLPAACTFVLFIVFVGKQIYSNSDSRTAKFDIAGAATNLPTPLEEPAPEEHGDKEGALKPAPGSSPDKLDNRTFTVSGNRFMKDGEPFSLRAGAAHYWRRPPGCWEDTMIKIRALGLNAVQTYISWNLHQPEEDVYNFEDALDIRKYIQLAQKHGLLVILRPSPFINAEVDMGGFPYWLLRINSSMQFRTSDPSFFQHVERWYQKLLPFLEDLLYSQGGPIVLLQVENEYGSYYACDGKYLVNLRDLIRRFLGPDILLFTTDGTNTTMVACGRVEGAVTTVDFGAGANVTGALQIFRESIPEGPFMNSEFYAGWIDHWSLPWKTVPVDVVVNSTEALLAINASFVFYPIIGGTNFGFTVGSNIFNGTFFPGTTSYDFDTLISESGDLTEKYFKVRELFNQFHLVPPGPVPVISRKGGYGTVVMRFAGSLYSNLERLSPNPVRTMIPQTFEELKHPYGFILYRTVISLKFRDPAVLKVSGLHDRAVILIDQIPVGVLSRTSGLTQANIFVKPKQVLDLLVQNEGRVTMGSLVNDSKGIIGNVTLQGSELTSWEHFPIALPGYPVKNPQPLNLMTEATMTPSDITRPGFYTGTFSSDLAQDTFLKMDNWHQGYAFINGYNLGRYWPAQGPQMTLFVPGVFLKRNGDNILQVFEVEESPCAATDGCKVEFVIDPIISGPTMMREHKVYDKHGVVL